MTTEAFKLQKLIEARSQCPEYQTSDLFWDETSKQWLPTRSAVQRLARNEAPAPRKSCKFKKGDWVFHQKFGEGFVFSDPEPADGNNWAMDILFFGFEEKIVVSREYRKKPERPDPGSKRIIQDFLTKI